MATTVARLEAILHADTSHFDKSMNQSESKMQKTGKAAGVLGLAMAGGLALGARHALQASSDLNEQMNKTAVVFGKSGKPKLKGRVLTTGYTASCPGTGPSCSITAAATIGRKKAGSGKATVNAGAKATIKVKLSKAAANQLKRKHKLKLSLKLTGKRTGAATTTTKRTLALKKKR